MQYDYSYCVNRDRSKTNYPATKRRTKTVYCTLSDRYPHPDAASLCVCVQQCWTIRWTGATSDNNFFPLVRQVRLYIRDGPCQKQQPTWFMAHLVLATLAKREGTRKDFGGVLSPVEHNAPIIFSPFYFACVLCLYNVPGVRVISSLHLLSLAFPFSR